MDIIELYPSRICQEKGCRLTFDIHIKPGNKYLLKFSCEKPQDANIKIDIIGYKNVNHDTEIKEYSLKLHLEKIKDDYEAIIDIPIFDIIFMTKLSMSSYHNFGISKIILKKL